MCSNLCVECHGEVSWKNGSMKGEATCGDSGWCLSAVFLANRVWRLLYGWCDWCMVTLEFLNSATVLLFSHYVRVEWSFHGEKMVVSSCFLDSTTACAWWCLESPMMQLCPLQPMFVLKKSPDALLSGCEYCAWTVSRNLSKQPCVMFSPMAVPP